MVASTGTLQAVVTVQVGSQVSGTIDKLSADFNTKVKAGQIEHARQTMQGLLDRVPALGANVVILGCTELPIAARGCHAPGLTWVDSNRCLAQEVVSHALAHGWSRRPGPLRP